MPKVRIKKIPKGHTPPQNDVLGQADRGGVIYPFGRSDAPENNPFFDYGGHIYDQNLVGTVTSPSYQKKGGNLNYPFQQNQGYGTPQRRSKGQVGVAPMAQTQPMDDGGVIFWDDLLKKDMGGVITAMKYRDRDGFSNQKKGGWLKGAINPSHKGWCTPLSNPHCTGHRRAFALARKKDHGFHKKDDGGVVYWDGLFKMDDGGGIDNVKPSMDKISGTYKYKKGGPSPDLNPATNHSIADYNPYIYFKNKNWYITSNPQDEHITETIKPIDREDANIEAEKGEYMVKPGLMGFYKVGGKKHSQGGTPLFAEGGSFIYSNDPKLSIKKHEKEQFGFKEGGSNAASKNTPAKVLGREVSPQEYNSYLNTITDDRTDSIAKNTAALMLEKLQQKMGQVAYIQEAKKGAQIPDFAQGTAPVKKPEFQDIEERMSEYAMGGKYPGGGLTDPGSYGGNPFTSYSPDMNMAYNGQYDIGHGDQYPGGRTSQGRTTPTGYSNTFNYSGLTGNAGVDQLNKDWKGVGVDLTKLNVKQSQGAMYDWAMNNNPQMLRDMWGDYGMNAQGKKLGMGNMDTTNLSNDDLAKLRSAYTDNMLGVRSLSPMSNYRTPQKMGLPGIDNPGNPVDVNVTAPNSIPTNQPGFNPTNTLPYDTKGKLNDAQVAHLGYLGLQALNINRYYPKREQVQLPQVRLDQINAQPFINQVKNQNYESYQLAAINPRTANLVGSNIYGRGLDATSQTLGNIANQNVQIGNQQNQINTQQATQQVMANSQFDNQYYNQVQAVNQNFDNEKRYAGNQFFSTLNGYKSQADQLAWSLAAVNKYGMRAVTDPKTGKTWQMPTPLYEANSNGSIRYNGDVANMYMASNANRINTPQEQAQYIQQLTQAFGGNAILAERFAARILSAKLNQNQGQGATYLQNPYGAFQ